MHEAIQTVLSDRERKTESGRLVRTVAANVEADYGRLRPTAIQKPNFEGHKDEIRKQIENDKHFR